VRGPYGAEREAYQRGLKDLGANFEVIELHTRDEAKAKGAIKDIILKRTGNLEIALRRFRNKPIGEEAKP
jgi:hypothetical protein